MFARFLRSHVGSHGVVCLLLYGITRELPKRPVNIREWSLIRDPVMLRVYLLPFMNVTSTVNVEEILECNYTGSDSIS